MALNESARSLLSAAESRRFRARTAAVARTIVRAETALRAGRYFIGAALKRTGEEADLLFDDPHVGDFTIVGDTEFGLLSVEHELELERGLERAPR